MAIAITGEGKMSKPKSDIELLAEQLEKGLDTTQRLVESLAKKGEATLVAVTSIQSELKILVMNVAKLSRLVVEGNGDSLVTKVTVLEKKSNEKEERLVKVEENSHNEAVSDAITDFKVRMLWGGIGTLLILLAGAVIKMGLG